MCIVHSRLNKKYLSYNGMAVQLSLTANYLFIRKMYFKS